jgi:carbon-monoxide dehydrogenase small subunit
MGSWRSLLGVAALTGGALLGIAAQLTPAAARVARYDRLSLNCGRPSMSNLNLEVNGKAVQLQVEPHRLLVEVLREQLGLTGTHVGCDTSQCGACTVLLDGQPVKSCTTLALQAEGRRVTSVEGLAKEGERHPIQQAFIDCHGLQCGFCTPGMIMSTAALLQHTPNPSQAQIEHALEGNLCRCTGYVNIVAAVKQAAGTLAGATK